MGASSISADCHWLRRGERPVCDLSGLANEPPAGRGVRAALRAGSARHRDSVSARAAAGGAGAAVHLRLGTTRGTNALITRSGARTALVTTRGFGDVLEIGYQARPRLFDLTIRKPPVLAAAVVEIDERVTHDGKVLARPQEAVVRQQLQALADAGIESLAICLLHADRHPRA